MGSTKEGKEAFVTGHTGTTPLETLLVSVSAPIGIFFYHESKHFLTNGNTSPSFPILLTLESIGILLPMAICQTEYLYPYGVNFLLFEFTCALFLYFHRNGRPNMSWILSPLEGADTSKSKAKLEYLSN